MTYFFVAIGAITAALIAGFFSYLNLIIAKEQKTSEFRQAWIDDLRKEISELISSANMLYILFHNRYTVEKKEPDEKFSKLTGPYLTNTISALTSISLRINPDDKDPVLRRYNQDLLEKLDELLEYNKKERFKKIIKLLPDIKKLSKPILKAEWERVKKGEALYRRVRKFAAAVLIGGLITALSSAFYFYFENKNNNIKPTEMTVIFITDIESISKNSE